MPPKATFMKSIKIAIILSEQLEGTRHLTMGQDSFETFLGNPDKSMQFLQSFHQYLVKQVCNAIQFITFLFFDLRGREREMEGGRREKEGGGNRERD